MLQLIERDDCGAPSRRQLLVLCWLFALATLLALALVLVNLGTWLVVPAAGATVAASLLGIRAARAARRWKTRGRP